LTTKISALAYGVISTAITIIRVAKRWQTNWWSNVVIWIFCL